MSLNLTSNVDTVLDSLLTLSSVNHVQKYWLDEIIHFNAIVAEEILPTLKKIGSGPAAQIYIVETSFTLWFLFKKNEVNSFSDLETWVNACIAQMSTIKDFSDIKIEEMEPLEGAVADTEIYGCKMALKLILKENI